MTSPYPYVLENAFQEIDFGEKGPLQVLTAPGDASHLYVMCRDGQVFKISKDTGALADDAFLDISDRTYRHSEEMGLFGFAFHPQFGNNGEVYACYVAAPQAYGGAAITYDIILGCLFVMGAVIGFVVPIPRRLSHYLLILSAVAIAGFLVFVAVPTAGLTSTQKKTMALGVFTIGFAGVVVAYRIVIHRNERLATRLAGMSGGMIGAGVAAVCLTLFIARSGNPSRSFVSNARSTSFQSEVVRRLARQSPHAIKSRIQYLLPVPEGVLRVSRFRRSEDLDKIDVATEEVLFSVTYPTDSHYGGSIEFGPDGYLYVGTGDGTFPHYSQDLSTLHGAILRVDVDGRDPGKNYAIPPDNPFGGQGDQRPEIWAYGLRNVWRLSFDQTTGQLWAGDVGLNRFEEVNLIVRGGNYGWAKREGLHAHDSQHTWDAPLAKVTGKSSRAQFIDPIITYDHRYGQAIVGGRVYHGKQFPELEGAYLYGDFISGIIWAGYYDGEQAAKTVKLASPKIRVAGFGEDQDGEMYICSLDGTVYRLKRIHDQQDPNERPFPESLSQTGLFSSTEDLTAVDGMIPYAVNVPQWSDGADQHRLMALPATGQVEFSETGSWKFPVGTVFVNTFSLSVQDEQQPVRRVETRLMVNSPYGWNGYTYLWNEDQTDADLVELPDPESIAVVTPHGVRQQEWTFLTNEQCNLCHAETNDFVLGVNTRQLNRDFPDGEGTTNQIELLNRLGVFQDEAESPPGELPSFAMWDPHGDNIDDMARSYLAVNCAGCHDRERLGITMIDMRYDTPLAATGMVGRPPRRPKSSRAAARRSLIEPGSPEDSELVRRLQVENEDRMPPLARSVPDDDAIRVVSDWIAGMIDPKKADSDRAAMRPVIHHPGLTSTYDEGFVRKLVDEIRETGDPNAGREIYQSSLTNCRACHSIGADEQVVSFAKGPSLAAVANELSMEQIVESIVWPERTIKKGFELTTVLLDDGRTLSGYVTSQEGKSMTIRDLLTGQLTRIKKDAIERQGQTGTAMPSDIVHQLTRSQLRDLVAYLAMLKSTVAGSAATASASQQH